MRLLLPLLLAPLLAVPAASAIAEPDPACEVTWRDHYFSMDHPTRLPDGVECETCRVTYWEVYIDMDHPTYVPNGVECD